MQSGLIWRCVFFSTNLIQLVLYTSMHKVSHPFWSSSPFFLSSSTFSLPIRTHACGLLRVICQIWRRSPGWQWGGVFLPFVARPYLPSFTSHISFGHVQYRGQLWPLNSWECSLATLAAVKETHPCFSQFTPVLPVALLLWCCAPALLVSAGVLVWF